ncbi:translational activator GCN1-like, partial [Asbolus verrucosus]
ININDELPKNICEKCIGEVIRCYSFKKNYDASEVLLLTIVANESEKVIQKTNNRAVETKLNSPDDDEEERIVEKLEYSETEIYQLSVDEDIKTESSEILDENESCETNNNKEEVSKLKNINNSNKTNPPRKIRSKVFTCSCQETFPSRLELQKHRKEEKHPLPRTHFCEICKKYFTRQGFYKHKQLHEKQDGGRRFPCNYCEMKFTTSGNLKRHVMTHTGERPHVCEFCGKGYIQLETLKEHRTIHTGEKPYLCMNCGLRYRYRVTYKVHIQSHCKRNISTGTKQSFVCEYCGQTCGNLSGYKLHLYRHGKLEKHIEDKYQCKICKRGFTTQGSLNYHFLLHGERQFLCNVCGKRFHHAPTLREHSKTHTGEKPYSCKFCDKTFRQQQMLQQHVYTHTGDKPHMNPNDELPKNICETCINELIRFYNFKKNYDAAELTLLTIVEKLAVESNNLEENLEGTEAAIYELCCNEDMTVKKSKNEKCESNNNDDCLNSDVNRELKKKSKNVNKNRKINGKKQLKVKSKIFTCSCERTFTSQLEFRQHRKEEKHPLLRTHPCEICKKIFTPTGLWKHKLMHKSEKRHICDFCGVKFRVGANLRRHIMQHTGERPYICEFCGKGFIRNESLKVHRRIHTGEKPYLCAYCGRSFRDELVYNGHLRRHTHKNFLDETFVCSYCGKTCASLTGYKLHLYRHGQVKINERDKYQCDVCKKFYTTQAGLNNHLVRHGEKKFSCIDCGKGFYYKHALDSHAMSHSGEKPYSCDFCDKTFARQNGLQKHVYIHTSDKPHACNFCPKKFRQSTHLTRHLRVHSGERPYICKYCDKSFPHASTLTLAKALKDLPYRVQTASLKQRKEVIESVIDVLQNPGELLSNKIPHSYVNAPILAINENIVKGICRVIQLTLPRYRDSSSQLLVRNLIVALLEKHSESAIKCLSLMLVDIASQHKNLVVTTNTCQTGLYALHWSCLVLTVGWKVNQKCLETYLSQIIETQALLLTTVVAAGIEKRSTKAFNLLNNSWNTVPESEKLYLEKLKQIEQTQYVVVIAACLAKRLSLINKSDLLKEYLDSLLEIFIKNFVSCKTRPLPEVIIATYPLLKQLTHELFKKNLWPSLQKAMLRNPEIILECVGLVISGLSLDLSPYAIDIGNSLIANLYSKDDQARSEAADACKRLTEQISDSKAINELLKKTFAVFHGSEGKLTVVDHKISVLQAAGNFSHNNVTGGHLQELIATIADYFIKILETEVHEKTLCHALDMFALWGSKFGSEIPKKVIEAFKNGMGLKTSTPLVRIAYIKCMLVCFNTNSIEQGSSLVPVLLKAVDRAVAQPTQCLSVTEGLCATCMLLKLVSVVGEKENNFQNLWNALLDMDKQIFVSEKFLSITGDDGLIYVMQLCEKLLIEYPEKLNGKNSPLHRAVLHCVIFGSARVRRKCLTVLKRMVGGLGGPTLARALFKELQNFLETAKVQTRMEKEYKEQSDNATEVSPHVLVECITSLCSSPGLAPEHVQLLALDAFLPTHHPSVVAVAPDLWVKVIKHLNIKPKNLIAQQADFFKKVLVQEYNTSPTNENALSTTVSLNAEVILPSLIETVASNLQDPRICQVSKDDYFTFLTPEGELYDKSVVPGYKEQLEELQLRREIEEKKKKDGKVKPPQYTPKQLEAIKNQKVKEQAIRARLSIVTLNTSIINCVSMVRAAAKGNPLQLSLYFKDLLPYILNGLQSPLAAPYLSKLFTDLRGTVFNHNLETLGELIAFVTLRLLKPQCDLDINWEAENLNKAMVRTVSLIHERTVLKKSEESQNCFTVPAFCYTFVLLKSSLLSNYARNHDELVHDGLQIVSEHSKLRASEQNGLRDIYDPQYLPIRQMFELLVEIISSTTGRIQSQAEACLLDVAACASGEVGCAKATLSEIDVLLGGLQNPAVVVRDAALRSLTIIFSSLPTYESDHDYAMKVSKRIWVAKFDENEENRVLADKLWELAKLDFPAYLSEELMSDIEHPVECVQSAASRALAALLENNQEQ